MNLSKRFSKGLVAVLVITLCLCGCQATPEKKAVVSKNQDYLKNLNQENVNNNMNDIPTTVKDSFSLPKGKVTIDAKVTLPDTNVFPMQKIKPYEITNDDVDKFVNIFLGQQPLYEVNQEMTKEEIEQRLIYLKEELAKMDVYIQDEMSTEKDVFRTQIADLESQYNAAKNQADIQPKVTKAHFSKTPYGDSAGKGYAELDNGKGVIVEAFKTPSLKTSMVAIKHFNKLDSIFYEGLKGNVALDLELSDPGSTQNIPNGKTTFEQARAQADKILLDLKLENFVLDYEGHVSEHLLQIEGFPVEEEKFYHFTYTKTYGGIPAIYIMPDISSLDLNDDTIYAESFPDETLQIIIDKDGNIKYAAWMCPGVSVGTMADNVQLLPFNEIMDKFKSHAKSIGIWNYSPEIINKDVDIYEIRLSMFKSALKGNPNEYITIPVWNFFCKQHTFIQYNGDEYDDEEGEFRQSLVTINAIDGSVINRSIGY